MVNAKWIASIGLFILLVGMGGLCEAHAHEQQNTQRIITAGGSLTEIVYALEQGNQVVATDSTSMYPASARQVTKLGYFRQLSTEGVLAQQPTLLLGASATGPSEMVEQVSGAGVKVVIYNVPKTLSGLQQLVEQVGSELKVTDRAARLNTAIEEKVAYQKAHFQRRVERTFPADIKPIKALFVVSNNDRGLTVAGSETVPQAMFDILGIQNLASALEGYKLINNEAVVRHNPDVIFVAGHILHGENALNDLCSHPAIAATFAGQHCLVKAMDSNVALGLSPRFPDGLSAIAEHALHALALKHPTPMKKSAMLLINRAD
jgi:iron complex transport system substrate-binding protein